MLLAPGPDQKDAVGAEERWRPMMQLLCMLVAA